MEVQHPPPLAAVVSPCEHVFSPVAAFAQRLQGALFPEVAVGPFEDVPVECVEVVEEPVRVLRFNGLDILEFFWVEKNSSTCLDPGDLLRMLKENSVDISGIW